ncbi:hypothetical protein B0T24DRAFT_25944 [Lasiosphaeria ovina]|uniref:Secreted protein n=1 Tax=Lasiosphaeria ovina TaxID=92902 RepID=A0AAE0NJU3_9PEZI|nr:hypothetical protein B0T24DRAFT_25944 [Lasiosphaeria ovina]
MAAFFAFASLLLLRLAIMPAEMSHEHLMMQAIPPFTWRGGDVALPRRLVPRHSGRLAWRHGSGRQTSRGVTGHGRYGGGHGKGAGCLVHMSVWLCWLAGWLSLWPVSISLCFSLCCVNVCVYVQLR